MGVANIQAWLRYTDKPFGIFGTTIQSINAELKAVLNQALFIYTRETKSIQVLKDNGIGVSTIDFAPDATFFLKLSNEPKAQQFLREKGLTDRPFICVVPRLRYTPYHKIRKTNWTETKIQEVESTNLKYKELDHAKLREAMIYWVRETGNRVLVCPEMTYQVDIMDELLIDPLPSDVKSQVLKRGYWLPDEAASIYSKAAAVLSFECHSPIIALTNNTPAFYLRQPEDTIKGQMYYDLKLSDWVFEIDMTTGSDIVAQLKRVWQDQEWAQKRTIEVQNNIKGIYQQRCAPIVALAAS